MAKLPVADACETHISRLFFTPDRVYKLLKPVATPFVDFSDLAARLEAATVEFEANRRISPDVYLGVADLFENDRIADRMIIMRRLSAKGELSNLLHQHDSADIIREVARFVARFHCSLDPIVDERATVASADAVAKNWGDNLSTITAFVDSILDPDAFDEIAALQGAYIDGRRPLFAERRDRGGVRDGHGDLRCEHLFRTDDGWRLIDCVAFRDDLRISDVLADVAFLAMDLHRLSGRQAAITLMGAWDEFTNEHHPASLAHFYVAYRAHVRCKIACLSFAASHDDDAANDAQRYHNLALEHLRLAHVRLVLVGGGAGTGKSTVSEGLASRLGAAWLRSDEIRKDLTGVSHGDHAFADLGAGIYSPEISRAVIEEMIRQTELLLARGISVVLDATWSDAESRAELRKLARATATSITEIRCKVEPAIAKERIARRMGSVYNPSDATPDMVDHIAARFDAWPEAVELCTAPSVRATIESGAALVSGPASLAHDSGRFQQSYGWEAEPVS